jgi:hypothetical protein
LISDGAPNFADAIKNEFFTINNPRTRHIRHIRIQGDHNRECWHGFQRKRNLNINTEQSIPLDYATVVTDTYSDSVRYRVHNSLCFFSRLCILSSIVRKFVVNSAIRG